MKEPWLRDMSITLTTEGAQTVSEEPTSHLRWVGKKTTTTTPRHLEQLWKLTEYDGYGRPLSQRTEWRLIPLHLED